MNDGDDDWDWEGRENVMWKHTTEATVNATDFFEMPSHITFHNKDDLG